MSRPPRTLTRRRRDGVDHAAVTGGQLPVYFGVSPTADPVAVKVIKPHLVDGHQIRERFAGEVESLKMVFGSRAK